MSRNGSISDGPNSYSASAGCIWVFENDFKNGSALLFKLDDFLTECCWDMMYFYDGDGAYGNLLGVFRFNNIFRFVSDLTFYLNSVEL